MQDDDLLGGAVRVYDESAGSGSRSESRRGSKDSGTHSLDDMDVDEDLRGSVAFTDGEGKKHHRHHTAAEKAKHAEKKKARLAKRKGKMGWGKIKKKATQQPSSPRSFLLSHPACTLASCLAIDGPSDAGSLRNSKQKKQVKTDLEDKMSVKWIEHSGRRGWDSTPLVGKPVNAGLIKEYTSTTWRFEGEKERDAVIAKAKEAVLMTPKCIGFAVHARNGVQLYNKSCFSAKGDLKNDPEWTTLIDNEMGDKRKVKKVDQALKTDSEGRVMIGGIVEDEIAEYMKGREEVEHELENTFDDTIEGKPFKTWALQLGQTNNGVDVFGKKRSSTLRDTGFFKGVVRVITDPTVPPALPMEMFAKENPVVIRLYVLRGTSLTPMDMDTAFGGKARGKEGYSDPYLKVELGDEVGGTAGCSLLCTTWLRTHAAVPTPLV